MIVIFDINKNLAYLTPRPLSLKKYMYLPAYPKLIAKLSKTFRSSFHPIHFISFYLIVDSQQFPTRFSFSPNFIFCCRTEQNFFIIIHILTEKWILLKWIKAATFREVRLLHRKVQLRYKLNKLNGKKTGEVFVLYAGDTYT